eukprot:TRINITY_DN22556_c1_g1_i1.p1 TRINITY_DN22556_c1_g1~~TRINITY_DN22556_c1_g1_i1.p1  ORF type:complete len:108 (-),score=6.78 TRINITY_DN22556_c1_g1_i1:330-653(-)
MGPDFAWKRKSSILRKKIVPRILFSAELNCSKQKENQFFTEKHYTNVPLITLSFFLFEVKKYEAEDILPLLVVSFEVPACNEGFYNITSSVYLRHMVHRSILLICSP